NWSRLRRGRGRGVVRWPWLLLRGDDHRPALADRARARGRRPRRQVARALPGGGARREGPLEAPRRHEDVRGPLVDRARRPLRPYDRRRRERARRLLPRPRRLSVPKVGFGLAVWLRDDHPSNVHRALDEIALAGYDGVELIDVERWYDRPRELERWIRLHGLVVSSSYINLGY